VPAAAGALRRVAVPAGLGADPVATALAAADAADGGRSRSAAVVAGLVTEREAAPAGSAAGLVAAARDALVELPAAARAGWWRAGSAAAAPAAVDGQPVALLREVVQAAAGALPEAAACRREVAAARRAVADVPPEAAEGARPEAALALQAAARAGAGRRRPAAAPGRPAPAQTIARSRPSRPSSTTAVWRIPEAHPAASLSPNKNFGLGRSCVISAIAEKRIAARPVTRPRADQCRQRGLHPLVPCRSSRIFYLNAG
jgi:hypothetical protein